MKKIIIPLFFILFTQLISAQPKPIPDETYGEGGYRIESEKTNVNDERESHVEYFDKGRNKKKRETITFKKDGTTVKTTIWFDCKGGTIAKRELKRDKLGNEIEDISENYDEKTKAIKSGYKNVMENGQMKLYIFDEETETYVPSRFNERPINITDALGLDQQCCIPPRHNLFLGYSFLLLTGENGESFPLGAHASYIYNVSSHIGLGLDASIHTKTINDEKLTLAFLLAEAKYTFGNTKNCDRPVIPDLHILAGLAWEKYGDSKGSGFAFGGGGGLDFKLSKKIGLSTQVDFIGIKFKGTDNLNSNLRASAGLFFNMGNRGHDLKLGQSPL